MRPRRGVLDRVLDQVQHEAVQVVAHAGHDRGLGIDLEHMVLGHRPDFGSRLGQDLVERRRLVGPRTLGVDSRQQQQVRHEPAHPPG